MPASKPAGTPTRPTTVPETLVAGPAAVVWTAPAKLEMTADEAVTRLYTIHYRSLVRLAILLVRDEPTAEEVVQECFIAMHDGWHRLREEDKALSYLKQAVVNRSRSVLRHRSVIDRNAPKPAPDMPSAEEQAISRLDWDIAHEVLQDLPPRQQQVLALSLDGYTSAEIAEQLGIEASAARASLHFARKKLLAAITGHGQPKKAAARAGQGNAPEPAPDMPGAGQAAMQVLALSLDGYTSAEIAEQLGIEASAARASLHFARKKLLAAITGHGQPKKAAARAGQGNAPEPAPDMPGAGQAAMAQLERNAVIAALRNLPDRQRQALVLRYYADLSEAQIADMMGITPGAVKSHTARGMSSLRTVLEQTTDSKVPQ